MIFRALIAAAALALLPMSAPAEELSEARIKELALQAILENPEIVMQAVELLQNREEQAAAADTAKFLRDNRDLLERDSNAPVLGNPEGDVTVVEFFDYNCPYCRRVIPEMEAALAADPNIRVVYREWPILGEASIFAARAALASRQQGLYGAFHDALMAKSGRVNEELVMATAQEAGLDLEQLRADMEAPEVGEHIATSLRLAQSLGFSGTPSFVIGSQLAPGLIESGQILEMVASARAEN